MATISSLVDKRVVIAITDSGICDIFNAFYLTSLLVQAGAKVKLSISASIIDFLSALDTKNFDGNNLSIGYALSSKQENLCKLVGRDTDLLVIAPCNDYAMTELLENLTCRTLTTDPPILIAPVLSNENKNIIDDLVQNGVFIASQLARDYFLKQKDNAKVVRPLEILGYIRMILGRSGKLAGRKIVITAGGTREAIDPVRVITNRSSGKQGYALAQAAIDEGAQVVLISTPTALVSPVGAETLEVNSADEMLEAVLTISVGADALIMAAAVADFRARNIATNKLKKRDGVPEIKLEATPDILAAIALRPEEKQPRLIVGFAAESQDLLKNAISKLESKKANLFVANDITCPDSGLGADSNQVTLLYSDGRREPLPLMSKTDVAEIICDRLAELL